MRRLRARRAAGAAVVTLSLSLAAAGCGSDGGDSADGAARLGDPVTLRASYDFPDAHRVDSTLTATSVVDPAHTEFVPTPAGRRFVEVVFRWRDRGADPLPWDDLRFTATTAGGARAREAYRVPPARKQLGSQGAVTEARVAFALPRDAELSRVALTSIVKSSPFSASWRVG